MANYKDIKGFHVQSLSSDPVSTQAEAGTWASGGDVNTARYAGQGSGTQTAGLATGGFLGPGSASALNESYNGTAFTEVSDLNTARGQSFQAGSSTACITMWDRDWETSVNAVPLYES